MCDGVSTRVYIVVFIVCARGDGVGKMMDQSEVVVTGAGLLLL